MPLPSDSVHCHDLHCATGRPAEAGRTRPGTDNVPSPAFRPVLWARRVAYLWFCVMLVGNVQMYPSVCFDVCVRMCVMCAMYQQQAEQSDSKTVYVHDQAKRFLAQLGKGSFFRVDRMNMLCYAMLCYAMLCYAMLCHAMLCYAILCCAILCCAMLCYAMLCYAMLCYTMLCYAML